jgi:hypothetical protein
MMFLFRIDNMALDDKTKKEISQLLALPRTLKENLEKRKKHALEIGKEKDAEHLASRFRELEKMLRSHYDYLGVQQGNLLALGRMKTEIKEEVVVIMHLTDQKRTRKFEEYMDNIWQQINKLKAKREKEIVLHEVEKAMTAEEHIINEIRIYFEKISPENKKDVETFKTKNEFHPMNISKHHFSGTAILFVILIVLFIILYFFFK